MGVKYKLANSDTEFVMCYSLTLGYVYDIEKGNIEDDIIGAIVDGTILNEDEVRNLLRTDAMAIFEIIKLETYPELKDENFDTDTDTDDKKKH